MFSEAVRKASGFTRPMVYSFRRMSGAPEVGIGTIVVVNRDGWFLTAKHLFNEWQDRNQHAPEWEKFLAERASIEQNKALNSKQKRHQIQKLPKDPEWVIGWACHWYPENGAGARPFGASPFVLLAEHDLALGKMDTFDASWIPNYPEFPADGRSMSQGASLCRLGFPFTKGNHVFDSSTGNLSIDVTELSSFPNDSIFTRYISKPPDATGKPVRFIETSTPGLLGQSGGPIFDRDGVVWSIQSKTKPLSLGFDGLHPDDADRKFHQFLNVGLGVAPETLEWAMRENGVAFATKQG